jgi:hypothetical protein
VHIALVAGFWGQNIGNAFFNLGGLRCLEAAGHHVFPIQDQPAYWTFRNESKGSYANRWPVLDALDVDLVVLQGPVFTRNFASIWADDLCRLGARGVRWAALSAGFRSYSEEERAVARDVIEQVPPLFLSTRDPLTASMLRHEAPAVRSGIDSAFFLPRAYSPPRVAAEYIALCFDHYLEPDVGEAAAAGHELPNGRTIAVEFRASRDALPRRSKAHAYVAQLADRRRAPTEVAGYQVVRPEHRTNPHVPIKIYRKPNAIASDEPWTYAAVYANAALTVSDRVHACVASLAYGTPARLHNPTTSRKVLFDPVGADRIEHEVVTVSRGVLDDAWGSLVEFLEGL